MFKQYYVYIITNKRNTVLYTGITSNLPKRIDEHKEKLVKGFSERYNLNKIVYYEVIGNPETAILREKEIKGWLRKKKIELIKSINPKLEEIL